MWKSGYNLAMNEEEDGTRVTGKTKILFFRERQIKADWVCEKKELKEERKGKEIKKVAVTWLRRWLWKNEVIREEQMKR